MVQVRLRHDQTQIERSIVVPGDASILDVKKAIVKLAQKGSLRRIVLLTEQGTALQDSELLGGRPVLIMADTRSQMARQATRGGAEGVLTPNSREQSALAMSAPKTAAPESAAREGLRKALEEEFGGAEGGRPAEDGLDTPDGMDESPVTGKVQTLRNYFEDMNRTLRGALATGDLDEVEHLEKKLENEESRMAKLDTRARKRIVVGPEGQPDTGTDGHPSPEAPAQDGSGDLGADGRGARPAPAELLERSHWEPLAVLCEGLGVVHAAEKPRERCGYSWSRTMAFAQVTLGARGVPLRRASGRRPFIIWALGATDLVEAHLAEQGFFSDTNWVDRAPTQVVLVGSGLRELGPSATAAAASSTAARPGRAGRSANSTLKKDDSATYRVVHPAVIVRSAPSLTARPVGKLFEGQTLHGREEDGWLRLDSASTKLCCNQGGTVPAWVCIDGSSIGLGQLLQRLDAADTGPPSAGAGQDTLRTGDPAGDAHSSEEGPLLEVWTTDYNGLRLLSVSCEPDLAFVFMPEVPDPTAEEPLSCLALPEHVHTAISRTPVVVTTRFAFSKRTEMVLKRELGSRLVLPQTRCPFSGSAGDPSCAYDDNGWIFAVKGEDALARALRIPLAPERLLPLSERNKIPCVFWGILDVKYDVARPVLERVKVLESGDGRTSKFSGAGAVIPQHVQDRCRLEEGMTLQKYHVVSADKKLTHDMMELSNYGHLIPAQACFPRRYELDLADRISAGLGVGEGDFVVLKLCNRSRAAGVIVVPVDELDEVLEDILVPPHDAEAWFAEKRSQLAEGSAADLGFPHWGCFEEQARHWWSNESPSFVVERCCASMATMRDGKPYDGTMRVGFALRRRQWQQPASDAELSPEDLEVEWLGGYWKLPKIEMGSSHLRDRVISAAKESGTAPVMFNHLIEVYAALGDSVQQLFGGAVPNTETLTAQYCDQPALAAYFIARVAMSMKDVAQRREMLERAESMSDGSADPGCVCARSFIHRCHGVVEAKENEPGTCVRWDSSRRHFRASLELLPMNANALYLMGHAFLESGRLAEAVEFMGRSMLLDPDFRGPYINLSVAYIRLEEYTSAVEICEACLKRFPQSMQSFYHMGVARCQMVLLIEAELLHRGTTLTDAEVAVLGELQRSAYDDLTRARASTEAARRRPTSLSPVLRSPWLEEDERMLKAMEKPVSLGDPPTGAPRTIELPAGIGWRLPIWRT